MIQLDATTGETPSQSCSHESFLPDLKSKSQMKDHGQNAELETKNEGSYMIMSNCFH